MYMYVITINLNMQSIQSRNQSLGQSPVGWQYATSHIPNILCWQVHSYVSDLKGEGYCVWHSNIPIRRQGIHMVSFIFLLGTHSAGYWSAHHTLQTRIMNVPATRDQSSWKETVYISIWLF